MRADTAYHGRKPTNSNLKGLIEQGNIGLNNSNINYKNNQQTMDNLLHSRDNTGVTGVYERSQNEHYDMDDDMLNDGKPIMPDFDIDTNVNNKHSINNNHAPTHHTVVSISLNDKTIINHNKMNNDGNNINNSNNRRDTQVSNSFWDNQDWGAAVVSNNNDDNDENHHYNDIFEDIDDDQPLLHTTDDLAEIPL